MMEIGRTRLGGAPRRLRSISDEGEGIEQCERTYIVLGSLELLQCRISAISRSIGLLCCQADDTLQADVLRIGFLRRQCQQLIKQGAEMDSRKTTTLQAEAASASRRKGGVSRTRWAWEREKEEKKKPDLGSVLEEDSADMIRSRVHDLEEGAARLHLGHASTTALIEKCPSAACPRNRTCDSTADVVRASQVAPLGRGGLEWTLGAQGGW